MNPTLADEYLRHTMLDDPIADAAAESLARLGHAETARFIRAGMDQDAEAFARAPQELRAFFASIDERPAWFDPALVLPGRRAFHEYSDLFIPAFVVVTLMNAASLVSKAFYTTGRVTSGNGVRRVRQNTRHFIEIMLPGSLDRHGDGWKLSVRIRLIHAQVRRLIRASGEWDESVYGTPLSLAHMGLSSANFSATMIRYATLLGARMDASARNGFMHAWRYASWLIGTPEALLFEGDEEQTHELSRIASACEPPPGKESAVIAHTLVQALPLVAGKRTARERRAMVAHACRVSRTLLGNELADRMELPRYRTEGVLTFLRSKRWAVSAARRLSPELDGRLRASNLAFLLDASMLGDLSYHMPDRLKSDEASPW